MKRSQFFAAFLGALGLACGQSVTLHAPPKDSSVIYMPPPPKPGDVCVVTSSNVLECPSPGRIPDLQLMVHWTTQEKCHECNMVLAIACGPDAPDCGVPVVAVDHWDTFDTLEKALHFVNSGYRNPLDSQFLTIWPLKPLNQPTLVGIFQLIPVGLDKKVTKTSTPQPPTITESVTYSAK